MSVSMLLVLPQSKRPFLIVPLGHAEHAALIVFAEITITRHMLANKIARVTCIYGSVTGCENWDHSSECSPVTPQDDKKETLGTHFAHCEATCIRS